MKVQAVNFYGNISKGREEFEKLPLSEQFAQKTMKKCRQKFNNKTLFPISAKDTKLTEYVRHVVFVEEFVKKKMKDIFANLKYVGRLELIPFLVLFQKDLWSFKK